MKRSILAFGFAATALASSGALAPAAAIPAMVVDLESGDVLYQEQATQPWYPASLTKLMTAYVALAAVRDGRVSLDTPLLVSTRAAQMPPSKMGFVPGTQVTLGNALKMMMVKSANDISVTIAEGVSGSVEAFADDMNTAAAQIGLRQSHFVNPNGLPDPRHYSSARDMAVIARALYKTFPDQAGLFSIGALALDGQIIANHNNLLGRYPGIDGMKTGFTCAAGFNVVASSERGGRHLAAVVMGAPNVAQRTLKTAVLLDRGFAGIDTPAGALATLPSIAASPPPDMRNSICKGRSKAVAEITADIARLQAPLAGLGEGGGPRAFFANVMSRPAPMSMHVAEMPRPTHDPVSIYVGAAPGYGGPVAQARPPHSPVGTDMPPQTASAYAPSVAAAAPAARGPLVPDVNALPLNIDKRRPVAKPVKAAALPPPEPPKKPAAVKAEIGIAARAASKAKAKTARKPDPARPAVASDDTAEEPAAKPKAAKARTAGLRTKPAKPTPAKPAATDAGADE